MHRFVGRLANCAAVAVLGLAAAAPARAQAFRAAHGLTEPEFQATVDQLAIDGWRLTKVDATTTASGPIFSAIWEPWQKDDPAENWGASHGLTEAALEAEAASYRDAGYKIVSVCGYEYGPVPLFAVVWHYDPSVTYVGKSDMNAEQYQAWFDHYANPPCAAEDSAPRRSPQGPDGGGPVIVGRRSPLRPPTRATDLASKDAPECEWRLVDVDGYLENGALRFIAVWYRQKGNYSAAHDMSARSFDWSWRDTGYEPTNVASYPVPGGGVRFAKIWNWEPGRPVFSFSHLAGADYQSWFDTKSAQGYRLVDVSAYVDEDAAVRYCSIWKAPPRSNLLQLIMPIGGVMNRDWVIVNYQDHDDGAPDIDYTGQAWLYSSHNGTDITIRNFAQMDAGVDIYAAADGVVVSTVDGNFDRNGCGPSGGPCGTPANDVKILHANGQQTWYTHLKKDSVLVAAGDAVTRGQKIAECGSSGNSSDAHLHFAVQNPPYGTSVASGDLVDPFEGPFGNSHWLWMSFIPYQPTTLNVLDGDTTDHDPTRLEHTERVPRIGSFSGPYDATDRVYFWFQVNGGVTATNTLDVRLLRPDDSEHWSTSFASGTLLQYNFPTYWFSLETLSSVATGTWRWRVEKSGAMALDVPFIVND